MSRDRSSSLQHHVLAELEWDPSVDASKIGVTAEGGVVTLTGYVPTYGEKWNAERVAKRIHGVTAVANDIEVRLAGRDERDDTAIAHLADSALKGHAEIPADHVKIMVSKGWITLEGQVDWYYQRRAAEEVMRSLIGIRGVLNQIVVAPTANVPEVKSKIEAALRRTADIDAHAIRVDAGNGHVTLSGKVRTLAEKEDALNAAWSAPGVTQVTDRLAVQQ